MEGEQVLQKTTSTNLSVQIAYSVGDLTQHKSAWHQLVQRAGEANVFYEPGAFMAAADNIPLPGVLRALLIYADGAGSIGGDSRLVGFIPLFRPTKKILGLFDELRLFGHLHCFLCTPLVDSAFVPEVVDFFLDWFEDNPFGIKVLRLDKIGFDGPFGRTLQTRLAARQLPHIVATRYQRALFAKSADSPTFLRTAIPSKRRKELRRLRNRLEDLGQLSLRICGAPENPDAWAEQFLELESRGWKGIVGKGAALANDRGHRGFFVQWLRDAQENGTLLMLSLELDGKPIAQKCSFRTTGPTGGSFAFKIAHDESLHRYSPGVQLELENIKVLHEADPAILWMDSCALPNHPMIDHLWRDRREIAHVICGAKSLLVRGALPAMARAVNRR